MTRPTGVGQVVRVAPVSSYPNADRARRLPRFLTVGRLYVIAHIQDGWGGRLFFVGGVGTGYFDFRFEVVDDACPSVRRKLGVPRA